MIRFGFFTFLKAVCFPIIAYIQFILSLDNSYHMGDYTTSAFFKMIRFPCVLYNPISVETWHFLPFQRALVYLWFFGEIPVEGLIFIFLYKVFKVVWLCQLFFQDLIICVLLHLRLVYINKTKTYSPTKRKEMGKNDIGFPFRCRFDPFVWVRSRPDAGFTFSRGAELTMPNGFWLECNTYLYSHMLVFLFYSVLLLYFFLQSYKDILIHWILINVKYIGLALISIYDSLTCLSI